MTGSPEFSSVETNASVELSGERARWLTSAESGIANCIRTSAVERLVRNHPSSPAEITNSAAALQSQAGILLCAFTIRAAALESVPESALSAKDRSLAD